MSFPTAGVITAFTYSDGDLPTVSGGIYSADPSNNAADIGFNVSSNTVVPAVALGLAGVWYNVATFAESENYIDFPTAPVYTALWMRIAQPSSSADTIDGYLVELEGTALMMYRFDNNVPTDIGVPETVTALANGDAYGASAVGTSIQAHHRSSGVWSALAAARTDGTYASGFIGFMVADGAPVIDNHGGGTVSIPAGWPGVESLGFPSKQRAPMPMIRGPREDRRMSMQSRRKG